MSDLYLVEDHLVIREAMRGMLQGLGHRIVGEAAQIDQAVADLSRLRVEVVLMDMQLGARSGLELLATLQQRDLRVPVVVLTMSHHPRDVADALRLGAYGYVLKDSGPGVLLRAIDEVAAGRRFLDDAIAGVAVDALVGADDAAGTALSPRERQVLLMVARGLTSVMIGVALHLSPKTVDTYRSRLMTKLGLGDVPAVVRWAIREGLMDLDGNAR